MGEAGFMLCPAFAVTTGAQPQGLPTQSNSDS